LAEGRLSERVRLRRSDELGDLADAFNTMAQRLEDQHAALARAHAGLEGTVRQRTAELQSVNQRLQAEVAEKEDFLRAVSHDLNAPLRNIAGMASMMLLKYGQTFEADALQRLERIQKNVDVECELINELLELSRLKTRRERIEPVNLQELVQAVAEQFSNDLERTGITLQIRTPLPVMLCERARMRQVFMNLVDNAIKYMRPEGPRLIQVSCAPHDDEIVIDVTDTGLGIAEDDLGAVFHVFRRAKSAAVARIPGKGVGLASVKAIIENYGGRLGVQSEPGAGTRFFMELPLKHFRGQDRPVVAA
jgi:signal transduction histidine kinase